MNWRAFKYLSVIELPITAVIAFSCHGWWTFSPIVFAFVLVPLLEVIIGTHKANLSEVEKEIASQDLIYDLILYLVLPIQLGLMIWFLFSVQEEGLSPLELIGRISGAGMLCGVMGINVAHELGHRPKKGEQFMAKFLLLTSQYMHFFVEHNKGHHKHVATSEDPATARRGESVYAFWIRSIFRSYVSAWKIQNQERKRRGYTWISWQNEMFWYAIIQLGVLVSIAVFFNPITVLYYLGAALIGILLLETVNYIEHYGLLRSKVNERRYENVQVWHSWNSDHVVGRLMLFELTRHSDHHFNAQKKYQTLDSLEEAPQMPLGYPGMMVISLIPPLWFAIMNKQFTLLAKRGK